MTPETQTVKWKRVWRDEYVGWICGFANAQGGVIEIGKDDNGEVVGVHNVLSLLEDIPTKVRALLGIVVEVNLKTEADREYTEIRNAALLPPDWAAVETGMLSRPHNPLVAQAFYRAGLIEAKGQGVRQIAEHCQEAGNPVPDWTREPGGVLCLRFPFSEAYLAAASDSRGVADADAARRTIPTTPTTPTTLVAGAKTSQKTTRTGEDSPEDRQETTRELPDSPPLSEHTWSTR